MKGIILRELKSKLINFRDYAGFDISGYNGY